VYSDIRVVPLYEPSVPNEERTAEDIVGAQGMVRETTDRHRREGLISVINRVLRHNVRNKLSVINGYAEILANDLNAPKKSSNQPIDSLTSPNQREKSSYFGTNHPRWNRMTSHQSVKRW